MSENVPTEAIEITEICVHDRVLLRSMTTRKHETAEARLMAPGKSNFGMLKSGSKSFLVSLPPESRELE